ncbi:hypothetical protein [Yinghuangia sp. YIM S09857]|uniref:hypothetical protein n=1 Tax=Yinghuangia sp. YIM S09857 TaxID=3436929 RepID=UPI003F530D75
MNHAGIEWLSAATDDPRTTRYNWTAVPYEHQLARPGRLFDAVITRDDTGGSVLERLAARLQPVGAVISDSRARHWAWLVGPGSEGAWRLTVGPPGEANVRSWYRYINSRGALLVPGPVPEPGAWLRWIVPPGLGENLTPLTALAVAFMEAAREP